MVMPKQGRQIQIKLRVVRSNLSNAKILKIFFALTYNEMKFEDVFSFVENIH